MDDGISAIELCRRVGLTYRVLDYWCRLDVLRPSVRAPSGTGFGRRFSSRDVRLARLLDALRQLGCRTDLLRTVAQNCEGDDLAGGSRAVSPAGDIWLDGGAGWACCWLVDLDRLFSGERTLGAVPVAAQGAGVA